MEWIAKNCTRSIKFYLIEIRHFARKSWRYMDIYRKGITGKLAVFAEKKYKSHRNLIKLFSKE